VTQLLNAAGEARVLRKLERFHRVIPPANFPYRRITGLAYLVVLHEEKGLFANFIQAISTLKSKNASRKEVDKLLTFFCLDATDYWSQHYTPGGKTLADTQQLIGAARSAFLRTIWKEVRGRALNYIG
jgi:hypothetical protein